MTLDELLALIPDQPEGNISAADLRTIVTELYSRDDELANRVSVLESQSDLETVAGAWQFSDATPPPTGNQLRLNNADQALATEAHFRLIDSNGIDRSVLFTRPIVGLRIQDADDAANNAIYEVSGAITVSGDVAIIPVAFKAGGGPLPNQKVYVVFAVTVPEP